VKVVIFCGGRGMRLESGNVSERLPKPMASIGGRPLLWHIMSYYAHFGHQRFVLCLGYRGGGIRDYFSRREFTRNGWEIVWINGGFFVFDRRVFDYVHEGDDRPQILGRLIADRQLLAIKHDGFWSPMDTLKDRERLEGLVRDGRSGWQVWPSTRGS